MQYNARNICAKFHQFGVGIVECGGRVKRQAHVAGYRHYHAVTEFPIKNVQPAGFIDGNQISGAKSAGYHLFERYPLFNEPIHQLIL